VWREAEAVIFIVASCHQRAWDTAKDAGLEWREWRYIVSPEACLALRFTDADTVWFLDGWEYHPQSNRIMEYLRMAGITKTHVAIGDMHPPEGWLEKVQIGWTVEYE
jgi:hypothetical protein